MLPPALRARLLTVGVAVVVLCTPLFAVSSAEAAQRSRLSADWRDTSVRVGEVVTVRGEVSPSQHRRTVRLQRRAGGRWVTVERRRTRGGEYTLRAVAARRSGRYTYRVRVARTARARAATGGRTTVRVRARGNPRAYAFISRSETGDPVARWNPCRRIGYRVNARQGGRGALDDAKRAVGRISRATGLRLVYQGSTRIIPGGSNDGSYPRDTDLVVAWAKPSQTSYLDGRSTAGMGGPWWVSARDERGRQAAMITRGFAVLNADIPLEGGFGRGPAYGWQGTRGQLLMHEIGHAIGLGHPQQDDRWEILYPTMTRKRAVWGAGDLRGLRRLGAAQGCLSTSSSYRGFAGATPTGHEHLH